MLSYPYEPDHLCKLQISGAFVVHKHIFKGTKFSVFSYTTVTGFHFKIRGGGVMCLFLCLLGVLRPNFYSYGDVTTASIGIQILTYTRHSWPMSSEGSLECHTYCDSHTYCRAFGSGTYTLSTCFYDLSLSLAYIFFGTL